MTASGAEKVNPEDLNGISLGDQIIDGKVVEIFESETEECTPLYYDEEGNVYDCVTVANEGTTQIVIGRDVISDGNGVELSAAGEEQTDLIIDGSLVATGGTFTVHLLKGRNTYTGKITLYSDGTLYLIGPDGLEMPINEKGDFTLIVGSERFSFVFTAADLAVLRACLP